MKSLLSLVLLGLVLLASPSYAANGWFERPNCTGRAVTSIARGESAFYCNDSTHGVANSGILSTEGVLYVTRRGDITASGAGTCEVTMYSASQTSTSVTGIALLSGDTTGDGVQDDLSLNGAVNRRGLYGIVTEFLMLRVTVVATGAEQCVIEVASR